MPDSPLSALFDSTSDDFDALTPQVWGPAAAALVDALELRSAERVLDVCAGTGAGALPAATAVGPTGRVVAVDFAGRLLDVAAAKAQAAGLSNVEFVRADVTTLQPGQPPCSEPFDAISCSYGIFFLPDMDDTARGLLRLLRPGGRLGLTVWHADAMRGFSESYFEAVAEIAGDTGHRGPRSEDGEPHPITRLDTEAKLSAWLTDVLEVRRADIRLLDLKVPTTADFAWGMVCGSAMRGALGPLDAAQREQVRLRFLDLLSQRGVAEVDCSTLLAVAYT